VQSPIFVKNSQSYSYQLLVETIEPYGAEAIDLSSDSLFINNPLYFQDRGHLNNNGATVFSGIIANSIKSEVLRNDLITESYQ
jgi:hypothetical protein